MASHPPKPESPDLDGSAPPDQNLPTTIDMDKLSMGEAFSSLRRLFQYSPALPERLRSMGTVASELFRDSANWFVPTAFRNSQSYSIFVRQMLEYVASSTSNDGVSQPTSSDVNSGDTRTSGLGRGEVLRTIEPKDDEVFLARKTVSGLLDMAALATFPISPLTVMAVFSEVAYGWKGHVQQLGTRLKEQRIIARSTPIDDTAQLLAALESALGSASAIFDKPLISIDGLNRTIRETQTAVTQAEPTKLWSLAEMDQLQRQMELAARLENASIWDVSATVSMVALNHIQAVGRSGLVTLEIQGNIFQHHIIDHYWEGLRAIERHGILNTLSQASQPFVETLWNNYAMDQKSWTEQLLSGELLKWGWSQLTWPKLGSR